jgi:hypothetical protein
MPTPGLRNRMRLGCMRSAAKWSSCAPVASLTIGDVAGVEPAAGHHGQAPACGFDRGPDRGDALDRRVALSAGQNTIDAAADERFHSLCDIAGHVERAMAGDRERTCRFHQRPHARSPSATRPQRVELARQRADRQKAAESTTFG